MNSHRAMETELRPGRFRRWRRIIIAACVLASIAYMVVFVRGLLFEAQMSLGIIRRNEQGIRAQIVNKEHYTPPRDGVLRPSQLLTLHEIARRLDSMARENADARSIESQLIVMLNRYTMSADEYVWVRTTATRYMSGRRQSMRTTSDSINLERVRMIAVDLTAYPRFYRDSADRSLML